MVCSSAETVRLPHHSRLWFELDVAGTGSQTLFDQIWDALCGVSREVKRDAYQEIVFGALSTP